MGPPGLEGPAGRNGTPGADVSRRVLSTLAETMGLFGLLCTWKKLLKRKLFRILLN